MAQLDPAEQAKLVQASSLAGKYGESVDRESAYEKLLTKVAAPEPTAQQPGGTPPTEAQPAQSSAEDSGSNIGDKIGDVLGSSAFKAFSRNVGSSLGREITRSLFGTARRRRR
jgi:hypothetical protein